MIFTSRELIQTLEKMEDNFITIQIDDDEYVIDSIAHRSNFTDMPDSHICLIGRYGGNGNLKR